MVFHNQADVNFWNKNFIILILSNLLLYIGVYMLFPVVHKWIVCEWNLSDTEASLVTLLFGVSMFLPGALNNYLVDTFKRKSVCTRSILLFALIGLAYPYATELWMIYLLRILQGSLFGIALMVTGSTLVIDVTPSTYRSKANWFFAFSGIIGMLLGVSSGLYLQSLISLTNIMYVSAVLSVFSLILVSMIEVCFRAPLDLPLFSFDRFILFRNLLPGVNMMTIPLILGTVVVYKSDYFFYLCIAVGFIVFWLLPRKLKVLIDGRIMITLGYAIISLALYIMCGLDVKGSDETFYISGFILGVGMCAAMTQFINVMLKLPLHCERGTGYHTYQLLWEIGVMTGISIGCYVCISYGCKPLSVSISLCGLGLIFYLLFTHCYFTKRINSRKSL